MIGLSALLGARSALLPAPAPAADPAGKSASIPDEAPVAAAASAFLALLVGWNPPDPAPVGADALLKTPAATSEKGREGAAPEGEGVSGIATSGARLEGVAPEIPADVPSAEASVADALSVERVDSSHVKGREAIRLDLAPEGLGAISLRLAMRGGRVVAVVLASRESAAWALRPEAEAARAALAAAGVDLASLVVAARSAGGEDALAAEDGGDGRGVAPIDGAKSSRRRRTRFDMTV
jgi:hypothetical protein